MSSDSEKQNAPADPAEPPTIYIASCGVLCDIFWWARRRPDPSTTPPSDESQSS